MAHALEISSVTSLCESFWLVMNDASRWEVAFARLGPSECAYIVATLQSIGENLCQLIKSYMAAYSTCSGPSLSTPFQMRSPRSSCALLCGQRHQGVCNKLCSCTFSSFDHVPSLAASFMPVLEHALSSPQRSVAGAFFLLNEIRGVQNGSMD